MPELETPAVSDDEQAPEAGSPATPTTENPRTYSEADFRKVQNEAKNLRTRVKALEALEAEVAELRKAAMSEDEKRAAQLKELQDKATQADTLQKSFAEQERNLRLDNAILREIGRLRNDGEKPVNFADPDDVLALLDRSSLVDEEGKLLDLNQALRDFAKKKPHLTVQSAPAAFTASPTNPPKAMGQQGLPKWADAQKFTPQQWAKYTPEQIKEIQRNR